MRSYTTAWLATIVLLMAGCAGSSRNQNSGAAPFDTVHIRSGDTLPPANPDTSATDSTRHDST